jgi:hypothetical protein
MHVVRNKKESPVLLNGDETKEMHPADENHKVNVNT